MDHLPSINHWLNTKIHSELWGRVLTGKQDQETLGFPYFSMVNQWICPINLGFCGRRPAPSFLAETPTNFGPWKRRTSYTLVSHGQVDDLDVWNFCINDRVQAPWVGSHGFHPCYPSPAIWHEDFFNKSGSHPMVVHQRKYQIYQYGFVSRPKKAHRKGQIQNYPGQRPQTL